MATAELDTSGKKEPTPLTKYSNLALSIRLSYYHGLLLCEGDLVKANHELATKAKKLGVSFFDFRSRDVKDRLPRITEELFWDALGVASGYSWEQPVSFKRIRQILNGEATFPR